MVFGSLFSGFGGLDVGLERAGMSCRFQVENAPYAVRVLERHFPDVRRYEDIAGFDPTEEHLVDLICGGDPCQGNSKARMDRPAIGEGPAVHFLHIIDRLRPRLVLRENPSDARTDAPWHWTRFRSELESLGYAVLPFRLRACCVGADHRRERVFLLAELPDSDRLGLEGVDRGGVAPWDARGTTGHRGRDMWDDGLPTPRISRAHDGLPRRMERLIGLGNAVDVRVGTWIGRRLMDAS